jgi:hypothetical protein
VDDFNRAGNFSAHLNLNGNLHPALGRRNFKWLQAGRHQIRRHLRCKPTVGDFGLPATLWREFQRIHFSSHGTFAAIHVPEKFGIHPIFIGDFDLPPRKRQIIQSAVVEAASS